MRNGQRRRRQNQVAVKDYVEIERSRAPKNSSNAPRRPLDVLQRAEQIERVERRFQRRDGVRENRLLARAADRKGSPNRANRLNRRRFRRRRGKRFDGASNIFVRRAPIGRQIRPKRDQRRRPLRFARFSRFSEIKRNAQTADLADLIQIALSHHSSTRTALSAPRTTERINEPDAF